MNTNDAEVVSNFDLENFSWDPVPAADNAVITTTKEAEEDTVSDNEEEKQEETSGKKSKTVVTGLDEKGKTEEIIEKSDSKQTGSKTKENDSSSGVGNETETLRLFRERGIIDFEDEELASEDFDEESFIETKFEEKLNTKLEALLAKLPPGLKDMIRYSANGGDFMEVVRDLNLPSELPTDLDISAEADQKKVISYMLKKEGKTSSEISDYIEFLTYKGTLAQEAENKYDKYLIEEETREERRIQDHKNEIAKRNEKIAEDIAATNEFLKTNKEVAGGVRFNRTEKKELPTYMYSPTLELEDGRITTPFNYELVQALKNREHALVLAKIVKSKFDMAAFKKELETKVVNEIENDLQDRDFRTRGSSQNQPKNHLVDFL